MPSMATTEGGMKSWEPHSRPWVARKPRPPTRLEYAGILASFALTFFSSLCIAEFLAMSSPKEDWWLNNVVGVCCVVEPGG